MRSTSPSAIACRGDRRGSSAKNTWPLVGADEGGVEASPLGAAATAGFATTSRPRRDIPLQSSTSVTNVLIPLMDQDTLQLIDETVDRVDAFWREHSVPMLLSALGNVERGRISREVKRHADGLRSFLEVVVGERVLVVAHSRKPMVVGVVPRNEDTRGIQDWDPLLDKTGAKATSRRLHPALWAAFRKPIEDAMERYVQVGESVRFTDVAREDEIPDGIRVERRFIVGIEASPEAVYENAMAWLHENQLEVSDFQPEAGSRTSTKLPSNDLLGRLILALDPRDLQRLSIPMDVVAKLRRQAD